MTSLIWKSVELFDEIEKYADPRVRNWFLMGSPISPIVIIVSYLYFVQKLGPSLMKNRSPFKIEKIIILYNAVQVFLAAYIVKEACRVLWFRGNYNFHCIEIDYSDTEHGREQARAVWVYFMTKLLDLLDTVFFVLRKKQSQVTFLHVYHHTLVFTFGWFVTKYYPGGHIAFFGTVNAFVHMIMYTYYLITALHLLSNKSLWWKKYITQLQLIQFIITGLHAMLGLFATNCNFPKYLIAIGIPQDVFMFWLFWDFYRKAYLSPKKTKNLNGTSAEVKNKKE
ncbi:very long chain fatty acid elongase AAEL008004-like [Planococcus citri]|uniref:very long chain fatty acid elongase AAEL008004-like n=1 Tax=Planococcus citri TaxID=170843 RepID=UPI0031F74E2A